MEDKRPNACDGGRREFDGSRLRPWFAAIEASRPASYILRSWESATDRLVASRQPSSPKPSNFLDTYRTTGATAASGTGL